MKFVEGLLIVEDMAIDTSAKNVEGLVEDMAIDTSKNVEGLVDDIVCSLHILFRANTTHTDNKRHC